MKVLVLVFLGLVAALLLVGAHRAVDASDPGSFPEPLVSCPNLDGSTEAPLPGEDPDLLGGVRVGDILEVIHAFHNDAGPDFPNSVEAGYVFLYDRDANGLLRVADIADVIDAFYVTCPRVDTEVA